MWYGLGKYPFSISPSSASSVALVVPSASTAPHISRSWRTTKLIGDRSVAHSVSRSASQSHCRICSHTLTTASSCASEALLGRCLAGMSPAAACEVTLDGGGSDAAGARSVALAPAPLPLPRRPPLLSPIPRPDNPRFSLELRRNWRALPPADAGPPPPAAEAEDA